MATAPAPAAAASSGGGTKKSSSKSAAKASGAGTKAKKPSRKKKPSSKSPAGSSNQATWSAARAAQMELASQRNSAAARLSDPLWYRVEDVLSTEETAMAENAKILPEQIQIVEAALEHNNLKRADVTPQAFACLLEQARRLALEIISDAQDYAYCANRHEVGRADLQLANEMRPDHPISFTTQLPKLNLLAQQINRVPLPPIPTQCYSGVLLPPKHHQLTARTFDVVSGAQVAQKMVQSVPSPPSSKKGSKHVKPSYGAARGRQIAIQLKEKEQPKEETSGAAPMEISSPGGAPAAAPSSTVPASLASTPAAPTVGSVAAPTVASAPALGITASTPSSGSNPTPGMAPPSGGGPPPV